MELNAILTKLQAMEIWEIIAALEAAAAGVGIDHEIWMLKQKLRVLEGV